MAMDEKIHHGLYKNPCLPFTNCPLFPMGLCLLFFPQKRNPPLSLRNQPVSVHFAGDKLDQDILRLDRMFQSDHSATSTPRGRPRPRRARRRQTHRCRRHRHCCRWPRPRRAHRRRAHRRRYRRHHHRHRRHPRQARRRRVHPRHRRRRHRHRRPKAVGRTRSHEQGLHLKQVVQALDVK